MRRYEKYKDSGIEWIGAIPEHWDKVRIKWISRIFSGGTPSKNIPEYWEKGTIPWLNSGSVNQGYIINPSDHITDLGFKNSSAKWIPKESLVLALAGQGKTKGTVAKLGIDTTCNQSMSAIVPTQKVDAKYLFYWLRRNYLNIRNLGGGDLRDGLNLEMIGSIKSLIPPINEQTTIANFLDRKTAEIDTLIESKTRLLELYEEEKTAIINRAVTKGINPGAPMKDSGIDWLGEIPEHWELTKIKRLVTKVGSGVTPRGGARVYKTSGIPLLRSQNVKFDCLDLKEVAYISEQVHNEMSNSQVKKGDVLLNITGASIGRTYYIEEWLGEANVNQHVCIIRPKNLIETKFLHIMLKSFIAQKQIEQEQTGSGREGLNFEPLKNFYIPFIADILEQEKLVSYVEGEISRIEDKKGLTGQLIKLLQEYREALINEVVTGKLKVSD